MSANGKGKMGQVGSCPGRGLRQKAREVIARTPELREERVSYLKKLVTQGVYPIDSRKTANSILAQLLLERGPHLPQGPACIK